MGFVLTTKDNTYGLVKYDYARSADYKLFIAGQRIGSLSRPLVYSVTRHSSILRIQRNHILKSVGAVLVSDQLRAVIEKVASGDVEFFPVEIWDGKMSVTGFAAMNVIDVRPCIDMEHSEYNQTNFDPAKPTFCFTYYKIDPEQPFGRRIALAQHFKEVIVVDEVLKAACCAAGLKGLAFASAIDLTDKKRSVVEFIK